MKQCFTYIDKKQNKTNFNSGQQSPMESKPLPTSDTRQLVYTHPSYALVEEHQFPQGPDIVRCHMMHTHKNKNNNNKKNMHWAWDKKSHSNTWTLALLRWWGIFNAKELFQAWGSGKTEERHRVTPWLITSNVLFLFVFLFYWGFMIC